MLVLIFIVGQLFDLITTWYGISFIPGMFELNGLANINWPAIIFTKIILTIIVALTLQYRIKIHTKLAYIVPGIIWVIVAWNILNIALG